MPGSGVAVRQPPDPGRQAQAVQGLQEANPAGPKTVLYVQPTSEVGGSDVALFRLITHLDRERYRPVVVLPRMGPLVARLERADIRVVFLPMKQLRSTKNFVYQMAYLGHFWPTSLRLARIVRKEGASLVHSNSLFALYGPWAAVFASVPHVWHVREIPSLPTPIRKLLTWLVVRLSARVIPMTNGVAQLFGPEAVRGGRVTSIPDGIDLATFNPSVRGHRVRRELQIDPAAPLLGFVGRLDPWKGADVFIRAAGRVATQRPDARFLICGGELPGYADHAASLKRLARQLGLDGLIRFTGWTYRLDDIPEVMAAIDVLVHTSVRPEPFGLVLVEAMATAKPVVASHGGGVPEVVEPNVTGLLTPPGDWEAVARAALDLLADPERAREMGRRGRKRAERLFDVGAYARKIEALYSSVLREPKPCAA